MNEQGRKAAEACLAWLEAGAPHTVVEDVEVAGFNMTTYGRRTSCGYVICMAGFVGSMLGIPNLDICASSVSDMMEIPFWDAMLLFSEPRTRDGYSVDLNRITADMAAATLRRYLETGVINWEF
jgi:hypothetical protein